MAKPFDQHAQATNGEADRDDLGAASDADLLLVLFNSLPNRAVFLDTNLVYRLANQEFLDFVGLPAEKVIGKSVTEILGPEIAADYLPDLERLRNGEVVRWEGWVDFEGRGARFIQEVLTPYRRGDDGPVIGFVTFGRDITELKRREADLAEQVRIRSESDAIQKAIVQTSLDCIIIVDGDGKVVDFNPASEKLFGFDRSQAIGREISELIIPERYRKQHLEGMSRYMASGQSRVIGRRVELEAISADGRTIPVELALSDVSIGESRYFTAHIRDLSAAKAAQYEIERQREALYQKEKLAALGSLLSGVAHELNNPLSIVIGQAMMLREKLGREADLLPAAADYANRAFKIENAANRCARIVKTFLAMARQRKAERTSISVIKVIEDAIELLSYSLKTSGVEVSVEAQDGIPETRADGDLIHQVLVNLIVNARQALEEKQSNKRFIRISASHDGDTIVVRLRDNGPGIPAGIRSRVFDPFFTTKPQEHGTGIGLAVSRGLMEAHGGTLELAVPQPEEGAEFVIRLPVTQGDEPVGDFSAGVDLRSNKPARGAVLIVDDEPELAELISDMVSANGFPTICAQSGTAAQTILSNPDQPIEAILCDIRMPDGDGPSLYDWLSANRPALTMRIGFITGDTLGPSAGRFLARTGCPVIEKPFTPDDIARVLESLQTDS